MTFTANTNLLFIQNVHSKHENFMQLLSQSEMPLLSSNPSSVRGRFLLKTKDNTWLADHDYVDDLTEYTTLNPAYALSFADEEVANERVKLLEDKIELVVEFVCLPLYDRRRDPRLDSRSTSQTTPQS